MTTPISGQVIYCTQIVCRSNRYQNPAAMLISWYGKPGEPTCERCARGAFDVDVSGQLSLAPLDGYQPVDLFAEAKQAAFATPSQVISGEPAALPTPKQVTEPVQANASQPLDDKVLRGIWADQVVYCRVRWCEESERLTPATQRLNPVGGLWCPACQGCIDKSDPSQVEIAPMSEEDTASTLQMANEYARDQHWSKPAAPADATWWILGSMAAASFLAGIGLCIPALVIGPTSSSTPGTLTGFGVILIVAAVLVGIIAAGVAFSKGLAKERAWKATLTPEQRLGVEVAETAALYATWAGVHHHVQKVKAENAANYQARSAAYRAEQAQRQQDQMAANLAQLASQGSPQQPTVPGPTQRSDIFGNFV